MHTDVHGYNKKKGKIIQSPSFSGLKKFSLYPCIFNVHLWLIVVLKNHSLVLHLYPAKIDKKSELLAGGLQVIQ